MTDDARVKHVEIIRQCRTKIEKMTAKSERIKILGVDATTGTLAKLFAVVGGSLVSVLMRQAIDV